MVRRLALAVALSVAIGCRSTHQASEPTPPVATPRSASEAAANTTAQFMRVHFIDVGQGAATLVVFPGETILVDTGGKRWAPEPNQAPKYDSTKTVVAYLDSFFAQRPYLENRVDILVLTHPTVRWLARWASNHAA